MKTNTIRYHIIRLFHFHQPHEGLTVDAIYEELAKISPEVTQKTIRTFLNHLEQAGILNVVWIEKVKHYFLNRDSLAYEGGNEGPLNQSEQQASDAIMSLVLALLQNMKQDDAAPIIDKIIQRIGYTYEDQSRWMEILEVEETVLWQNLNLFGIRMEELAHIYEMMRADDNQIYEIQLIDGNTIYFNYERLVIKHGVPLCIGSDQANNSYCEIQPWQIDSLRQVNQQTVELTTKEQNRIDESHLTIGTPTGEQAQTIRLALNKERMERIKNMSLPLDAELDEENQILELIHPATQDLANWVMGLGPGVTVIKPEKLQNLVIEQLHESLNRYWSL